MMLHGHSKSIHQVQREFVGQFSPEEATLHVVPYSHADGHPYYRKVASLLDATIEDSAKGYRTSILKLFHDLDSHLLTQMGRHINSRIGVNLCF